MRAARKDVFVIGFALFSMFFGAGNVIFPPYLGLESGPEWLTGFFCYYLADIGLALLTLLAMVRQNGAEGVTRPLGPLPSKVLLTVIVLCIGPLVAIPRTAATTYEMSIAPLLPGIGAPLLSTLFFLVIFLLCVRESAVVDIVGKVLTPALLAGLLVLICKGVATPLGPVSDTPLGARIPAIGIEAGYQTLDVLAALLFGSLILQSARERGYAAQGAKARIIGGAGAVAGVSLLGVYLGLTWLGATVSTRYTLAISRSNLVLAIVHGLLGTAGVILFAIVAALACITTAVALVSASAAYFSGLSKGRASYPVMVGAICVFSAVAANIGLEAIVSIASPILNVVYPPALVLILLGCFNGTFQRIWIYRLSSLSALLASLFTVLNVSWMESLPLAELGFGWVLPAVVGGLAGALLPAERPALP